MSKQKNMQKKKNATLQRILWCVLVIFAIVLIGLWTFEPEIIETQTDVIEPTGEVNNQVRIQLKTSEDQPATLSPVVTGGTEEQAVSAVAEIKKITEDSVVRPEFITRLSKLLVKAYKPKGSHPQAKDSGKMFIDAKSLNVHYGIEMTGLAWSGDDLAIGRRTVMRYALRPTMISALYALYKDRFMTTVAEDISDATRTVKEQERKLSAEEQKEFYKLTAQKIRATADVLKVCAESDSAMTDIGTWLQSERDALTANQKFQSALHDYQISTEVQATNAVLESAENHMKKQSAAYEKAIREREAHKKDLATMLRKYKWAKGQDNDTNLYIASWVYRRSKELANPKEVLLTIHEKLLDLASTMDANAK